jgi:hypothetical protein
MTDGQSKRKELGKETERGIHRLGLAYIWQSQ